MLCVCQGFDLSSPRVAAAVNSVVAVTPTLMVAGHQSGALSVWDVRAPREPMIVCSRSASAVLRVAVGGGASVGAHSVIAAGNDGAVSQWHMAAGAGEATIVAEYTGADCEPVRGLAVGQCPAPAQEAAVDASGAAGVPESLSLFAVGDDGVVRAYSIAIEA